MRLFHPWVRQNLKRKTFLFLILFALVVAAVYWRHNASPNSAFGFGTSQNQTPAPAKAAVTFNKQQYSVNDPSSLWVIVNKGRTLPSTYAPQVITPNVPLHYGAAADDSHLRPEAATALEQMFAAAKADGILLRLYSGYRSYANQTSTYNGFVKSDGVAKADTYSARPGHSEHQTGLAADISALNGKCDVQQCFDSTPEGQWLAANAYKYGFILRYTKAGESLTGYEYEPWHFRYLGTQLAAEINKTGQSLEQFFSLPTYKLSDAYPTDQYQLKAGG